MAILKCKMCGGDIELSADKTCGICSYCGSTMTFPKVDDEQRANRFNRGNQFRRAGEFDKALAVYEQIVQEDENDAEAHWCCALCRFGIEYVEDPNTFEYLPTCHRASFDSFLEDVDYLAALEHSDGITRRQYQKDAAKIAEVQRGILATSQNEEPFDVFLCYKETEDDGSRTRDSLYAQDIYYQLTEQGRRVFFSRITLEDKAGTEYEPYIFAALNSAKVMILVTTSAEHANSVWVKNEWSRFLSLMRKDRSKLLLPCYRDMDPYDLPEALSVLQSYDMSKIGFIQDLIRGVNKVLNAAKPKAQTVKETVVVQPAANPAVTPLLKRAFLFLEDGDWQSADEYCEKVLDMDPENGEAYLGKLMTELHVRKREGLKDQPQSFENQSNYAKAMRFGSEQLRAELTGILSFIQDRNETARQKGIYQRAMVSMSEGSVQGYRKAAELFASVPNYADAKVKADECCEKAEIVRQDGIYQQALAAMQERSVQGYQKATTLFSSISDYKDARQKIANCAAEVENLRREQIYQKAVDLTRQDSEESFQKAAELFASIPDYRDAQEKAAKYMEKAEVLRQEEAYKSAVKAASYHSKEELEEAVRLFGTLSGYKDADKQLFICQNKLQKLLAKEEARRLKQRQKGLEPTEESAPEERKRPKYYWASRIALMMSCFVLAGVMIGIALPLLRKKPVEGSQPVADATQLAALPTAASPTETSAATAAPTATAKATSAPTSTPIVVELQPGRASTWHTIAAADLHTVALKANGTVVAVGSNGDGRCNVSDWTDIVSIAAGKYHTVGLKADGTVVATGNNGYGQCNVSDWKDIISVAAGALHTVGLKSDGTVVAVGHFGYGQCDVSDWKGIVSVAAGERHTVGLKANGTVIAVGSNDDGRCNVSGWTDIVAISAGNSHTVGLKSNGVAFAVGDDRNGQCDVSAWPYVVAVSAGYYHTVGLKTDGTVIAVGNDTYGRLGVSRWKGIVDVAAGNYHTVGLKADGSLVTTNYGNAAGGGLDVYNKGQYNVFDWTDIRLPDTTIKKAEASADLQLERKAMRHSIAAGEKHSVAIKTNGNVVTVGLNDNDRASVAGWKDIVSVATGRSQTVGLKADGTVIMVSSNGDDQRDLRNVEGWTDIVAIAAGKWHTVGLKNDGTVMSVGNNSYGQRNVSDWRDIIAVSAGTYNTAGIKTNGTVVIVGANSDGQCNVSEWTEIMAVAVGDSHTVGLKSDGTVVAVGSNRYGQCDVSDWTDIVIIAAGDFHTVGLKADGTVVAVGWNGYGYGQCNVSDWKDIVAIAAGLDHTVGLKADGTVVTTGNNDNGQCDVSSWTDIRLPGEQPAVVYAWSVIGNICGTGWARDFPMTEVEAGVWQSDPLDLKAGEELKVRANANWKLNYGVIEFTHNEGKAVVDGSNIKVSGDGLYVVVLDLNAETLALVAQN